MLKDIKFYCFEHQLHYMLLRLSLSKQRHFYGIGLILCTRTYLCLWTQIQSISLNFWTNTNSFDVFRDPVGCKYKKSHSLPIGSCLKKKASLLLLFFISWNWTTHLQARFQTKICRIVFLKRIACFIRSPSNLSNHGRCRARSNCIRVIFT